MNNWAGFRKRKGMSNPMSATGRQKQQQREGRGEKKPSSRSLDSKL